jgi:hypothetical protein
MVDFFRAAEIGGECSAVALGFGADPAERYHRLAEFGERYGLGREMDFWRRSEPAVRKTGVV